MLRGMKSLNKNEAMLWMFSVTAVTAAFLAVPSPDVLTLAASLIGVTALIYVAKGLVIGQLLTVVFAVFYGVISFFFRYYGEMITYLGMTSPIAVMAAVEWLRNPYEGTAEVQVRTLNRRQAAWLLALTVLVTAVFHVILKALGNANLLFSTISIATSFLASALTLLRSRWYAAAYAANDVVLIVLWLMASAADWSYFPMVVCFGMFFINDLYGYCNWRRMQARQSV